MDGTEGDDGVVAQGVEWVDWMGTRLPSNHPPLTEVVDSNPNDFLVKALAFIIQVDTHLSQRFLSYGASKQQSFTDVHLSTSMRILL